jgi:hypothetical protein
VHDVAAAATPLKWISLAKLHSDSVMVQHTMRRARHTDELNQKHNGIWDSRQVPHGTTNQTHWRLTSRF